MRTEELALLQKASALADTMYGDLKAVLPDDKDSDAVRELVLLHVLIRVAYEKNAHHEMPLRFLSMAARLRDFKLSIGKLAATYAMFRLEHKDKVSFVDFDKETAKLVAEEQQKNPEPDNF